MQRQLERYFSIFAMVKTPALTYIGYFVDIVNFCGIKNKMASVCHGICQRIKSKSITRISYEKGQKYCTHCGCFFKYEGIRCSFAVLL